MTADPTPLKERLAEIRKRAWETRRATYGPSGHGGAYMRGRNTGAVRLLLRLHNEGVLSEGQVSAATGLDRVEVRRRADALQQPPEER